MTATQAVMWGYSLLHITAKDDAARERLEEWVNTTNMSELREREQERRLALVAALGGVVVHEDR